MTKIPEVKKVYLVVDKQFDNENDAELYASELELRGYLEDKYGLPTDSLLLALRTDETFWKKLFNYCQMLAPMHTEKRIKLMQKRGHSKKVPASLTLDEAAFLGRSPNEPS
jgi:hypothetical protein